jgi:glucosamine--fructose-6-phosphate aminotransferase (isomerizing)
MLTEGMNAAEFRHGPIELADNNLSLIVLEGDRKTSKYNHILAEEVNKYGSQVIWIGNHPPESINSIRIPEVPEIALPLAEILVMQLITLVLTNKKKLEAGKFRHIGKIVLNE